MVPLLSCGDDDAADDADSLKIVRRPNAIYIGSYDWAPISFDEAVGTLSILAHGDTSCIGGVEGTPISPSLDCLRNLPEDQIYLFGLELSGLEESIDDIINGVLDEDIGDVAQAFAEWGRPVFWLYQREPSIQFPGWGPTGDDYLRYEGDRTGYFGDPTEDDAPERYVALQRRIHDVAEARINSLGLLNRITWVQGAIIEPSAGAYRRYWIGEDYVDWHAMDIYFGIDSESSEEPPPDCALRWADQVEHRWAELTDLAPGKPVMLVEFGASAAVCDREAYFRDLFAELEAGRYGELGAFMYWQENDPPFDCYLEPHDEDPAAAAWHEEITTHPERWSSCALLSDGTSYPPDCQ